MRAALLLLLLRLMGLCVNMNIPCNEWAHVTEEIGRRCSYYFELSVYLEASG